MKTLLPVLILAVAAAGCATRSRIEARSQAAFLAGQNAALLAQQQNPMPGVTIIGEVQNPRVPWVVGLTLAQAIAKANYVGADEPNQIIITRRGESAAMDAKVLLTGTDIPLQYGDVVELR